MLGSLGVQQGEAVRVGLRGMSRSSFDDAYLGVQIGDAVMVGLNGMSVLDPLVLSPLRVEERSMKSSTQVAAPNLSEPLSLGTDRARRRQLCSGDAGSMAWMNVFRTTLPRQTPLGQVRTTGVFSCTSLFGSCNGVNCGLHAAPCLVAV